MEEPRQQAPVAARSRKAVAGVLLGAVLLLACGSWYELTRRASPAARYELGLRAFEVQNSRAVGEIAAELSGKQGYEPHAALLKGMAEYLAKRYAQAIVSAEPARNSQATKVHAWRLTGMAYHAGGRAADAIQALNNALATDADDIESHRLLAVILYDLGAMFPCLGHLDRIAELDPADARSLRLKGLINKDYDFHNEAIEAYQEALRRGLTADVADEVRLELAECLTAVRRYDDGAQTLEDCRESMKRDCLQAECKWAEGDIAEAHRLAENVLLSDSENKLALQLATKIAVHEKRSDDALRHGEMLLRIAPHDPAVCLLLSQVYRLVGDREKSAEMIERQRQTTDMLVRLRKLHEDALADQTNADLRYRIAELSLETGRADMARSWLKACLALDPGHAPAREMLARLPVEEQAVLKAPATGL